MPAAAPDGTKGFNLLVAKRLDRIPVNVGRDGQRHALADTLLEITCCYPQPHGLKFAHHVPPRASNRGYYRAIAFAPMA